MTAPRHSRRHGAVRNASTAADMPRPALPDPENADQAPPHDFDRAVNAQLARFTLGLSPASSISAWMDWLVHLRFSPGKQMELASKAASKALRLGLYATQCASGSCEPCIEPLPQDRRFKAPEWQQWPYNFIYQAFLLNQQWWDNATTGVRGVTHHHEQRSCASPHGNCWTSSRLPTFSSATRKCSRKPSRAAART